MYRIDDATAATSLPTPETAGTEGYFTEGNPATGTPATKVRGSWLNMIQEELCAILAAAGITRSKTTYNQVNSALQKMYAPVVGTVRNLTMSVTAASATATLTADEIIVESALGGQPFKLASLNKTINLATTGAGGMDTGSAPVSGYVALYAIYNPTTGASALLATNATSAVAPNVYGGANMPSGYTASALVSAWPTNSSRQFVQAYQRDRTINLIAATALSSSVNQSTYTLLSLASIVPPNAIEVGGTMNGLSTSSTTIIVNVSPNGSLDIRQAATSGNLQCVAPFNSLKLIAQQGIYYVATCGAGTPSYIINIGQYSI
ncbi:hypothetical protein [Paraburkholderia sp. A3RO-2L]|uniref:hypothetical protein n=1 Tax=Paraburkholderia sp. A3RO-2L TaxID=3028376 RepID=UPI003DA9C65B